MGDWLDVEIILLALFVLGLVGTGAIWWRSRARESSLERLRESPTPEGTEAAEIQDMLERQRPEVRPSWLPFWLFAIVVSAFLFFFLSVRVEFAVLFGLVVGVVGSLTGYQLFERKLARLESQLADTLDLVIAALHAGAGVLDAFESATRESRQPLRPHLERITGRIRLGDDPRVVFADLTRRLPIETVRLFALALSVHWDVGGNLAPTLSTVARTIRDRVETGRRVRTQSAQARMSLVGVLVVTYGLGLVLWRADPPRMEDFVSTTVGGWLIALAMLLQLAGIGWMVRLSRIRY